MRTQFSKLALAAGVLLAITFTLGCEEKSGGKSSSSADEGLPSSATVSPAEEVPLPPPKEEAGGDAQGGCPNAVTGSGTLSCGGQTYKTVKIGGQVWMAENLSYDAEGTKCYENDESNCQKYGRLYNWETAGTACPKGWHLPSDEDWNALMRTVNPACTDNSDCADAGTKLKSTSGWNEGGNGTDVAGFAALPGGRGNSGGSFYSVGDYGLWWSNSEYAYLRRIYYNYDGVNNYDDDVDKSGLFSVRCVQD